MPSASPAPDPTATPSRARDDACPGTLRLHIAEDGALARVRVPGGVLDSTQAAALLEAARTLGDAELHLTSRGNVQLRGLEPGCSQALSARLEAAGLLPSAAHERVRNIVASPLAGLDRHGTHPTPVRDWLHALDSLLCESEECAGLSGRFLFALDDGRGDVAALGADITLRAVPQEQGTALLRLGADGDPLPVPAAAAPRAALLAAEAFLRVTREAGVRVWRVAELPGGAAALAAEVTRVLRTAGIPTAPTPAPETAAAHPPVPGLVTGPDPYAVALSVLAPLGRLTAPQWQALTDAAADATGELRLTPWRGAVVPGVPAAKAPGVLAALAATGLITEPDSPWVGVGACAGRPGCAKSLADVRADAATALGAPGGLPVYWSGCARRCGRPPGEHVDVVATPDGYEVSITGGEARPPTDRQQTEHPPATRHPAEQPPATQPTERQLTERHPATQPTDQQPAEAEQQPPERHPTPHPPAERHSTGREPTQQYPATGHSAVRCRTARPAPSELAATVAAARAGTPRAARR